MIELTSKQRAELRAEGNLLKPIVFIGKDGLSESTIKSVEETFQNRELVKVKLLQNCSTPRQDVVAEISKMTGAASIQQIGRTILFYRPFPIDSE